MDQAVNTQGPNDSRMLVSQNRTETLVDFFSLIRPHLKHVFEYDVGKKGAKKSLVMDVDEFSRVLDGYFGEKMTWNEVIHMLLPCRMYLDCELDREDAPECVSLEEYVTSIHVEVANMVQSFDPDLDLPLVLCGSRPGKFSIHLVWPTLWCKTTEPALAIAEHVASKNICDVNVDLGVYPTKPDTPKTLRMPFCFKLKDLGAGAILPLVNGVPTKVFDREVFFSHLITFHTGHTKIGLPLPEPPTKMLTIEDLGVVSSKRPRYSTGVEINWNPTKKINTLDWMEEVLPVFSRIGVRGVDEGGWKCYGVLFCETQQRWHKSNFTYVNCDKYGNVLCRCSDPTCRVTIRMKMTEHQYAVASKPWSVDWNTLDAIMSYE